jgi:hypothetical protein
MVGISADRTDSLCVISDPEEVAELAARIGLDRSEKVGSFDTLLAAEAMDYRGLPLPTLDSPTSARVRRDPTPGSLTDLLGRLRTLQPKQNS